MMLTARPGYIYTNGETYGYEVHLGVGDLPENWWEITEEEYEQICPRDGMNELELEGL